MPIPSPIATWCGLKRFGLEASTVSPGSMPGGAVCVLIAAVTLVDGPTVAHVRSERRDDECRRGRTRSPCGVGCRWRRHPSGRARPRMARSRIRRCRDVRPPTVRRRDTGRDATRRPAKRRGCTVGRAPARSRSPRSKCSGQSLATLGALAAGAVTDRSIAADPRAYHSPSVDTVDASTLIGPSGSPSAGLSSPTEKAGSRSTPTASARAVSDVSDNAT